MPCETSPRKPRAAKLRARSLKAHRTRKRMKAAREKALYANREELSKWLDGIIKERFDGDVK